jgi:hypothetical protein
LKAASPVPDAYTLHPDDSWEVALSVFAGGFPEFIVINNLQIKKYRNDSNVQPY